MSVVDHNAIDAVPRISEAEVGDYLALLKPRVMSLVVFTALVGLVIAPGHVHPVLAFTAILCIAVGAGASGALNMWYDADIDALMSRTANRPIPRGRDHAGRGAGVRPDAGGLLGDDARPRSSTGWPAALLAFTIFFYVVVYTMWLKRWTPQNIVIGGAAGALPPVIGWAAATGSLSHRAAAAVPRSSSSGRRRISGRWRCSAPTTTPAPACRCCRWSPVPTRRGCRSCSTRSCWSRSRVAPWPLGYFDAVYGVDLAGARRRHAVRSRSTSTATARASRRCAPRDGCSPSRSSICSRCSRRLLLEVVVRAVAPSIG